MIESMFQLSSYDGILAWNFGISLKSWVHHIGLHTCKMENNPRGYTDKGKEQENEDRMYDGWANDSANDIRAENLQKFALPLPLSISLPLSLTYSCTHTYPLLFVSFELFIGIKSCFSLIFIVCRKLFNFVTTQTLAMCVYCLLCSAQALVAWSSQK